MEKGLKGYRPLLLLLLCGGMTLKAAAQAAITDPLNTAQSTLTAGNTAATVKQVTESVNRLQTALDYVQKVSATVRRARMFTDLIDRQNRLNSNCLRTLEEAEKMDMKGLPGITSAVQDVVANNAAIISPDCGYAYLAGACCAGAGAGAVVWAGACLMEETLTGVFTAKDEQMLSTQITMASVHVAFSMKSVVLR